MSRIISRLVFVALFVAALGSYSFAATTTTDDEKENTTNASERFDLETEDMKSDSPVMKDIISDKKISRRLPTNYGSVVSPKQREEIYEIQEAYLPLINLLQARLDKLRAEMNAKVENVLTEEQRKKVEEASAASRTRRATSRATTN
ncbi:MAG: hypothetical protein ACRC2T_05715 [Thermoguttaceae bacterium]